MNTLTQKHLNQTLEQARIHKEKACFVFDLDSTLFLTKYRTQAILNQFIKTHAHLKSQYPSCFKALEQAQVQEQDYFGKVSLQSFGLKQVDFIKKVLSFWKNHFFTEFYIPHDKPYPQALAFVQYIHQFQSPIYYLTARSLNKTYQATYDSLKQWNFPLKTKDHLFLKPSNPEQTDKEYKLEKIQELSKAHKMVLFFDNEPVILNFIHNYSKSHSNLKNVQLFWINSSHSHKETIIPDILEVTTDYSFDRNPSKR